MLTNRPALFDRAFQKVFDPQLRSRLAAGSPASDSAGRWALARFWSARAEHSAATLGAEIEIARLAPLLLLLLMRWFCTYSQSAA